MLFRFFIVSRFGQKRLLNVNLCSTSNPHLYFCFCSQISAAPINNNPTYEDNVKISTELASEYLAMNEG